MDRGREGKKEGKDGPFDPNHHTTQHILEKKERKKNRRERL
jgi:hypothetical protein